MFKKCQIYGLVFVTILEATRLANPALDHLEINVSTKKLYAKPLYKKAAQKMLVKLTPYLIMRFLSLTFAEFLGYLPNEEFS
jgi:hypothetical protein